MAEPVRIITGPRGQARKLVHPPVVGEDQWNATIDMWVINAPGWSPAWSHFTICVIHLRDMPGIPSATLNYPEAAYEIMVATLDPSYPLDFNNPMAEQFHWLQPFNVVQQFHGPDDAGIEPIMEALIEDAVQGHAIMEPQGIVGGTAWWADRLESLGAKTA